MYLSIENLPRELRFKSKIVGIIPGPSESSMNIDSYLEPLIDELLLLWDGITVTIMEVIWAPLSCIACDVPAARNVGGFIGHKGKWGCSRCLNELKASVTPDYSSFKKCDWEPRTHALHDIKMLKLRMRGSKLNLTMVHDFRLCFAYHTTMLYLHV